MPTLPEFDDLYVVSDLHLGGQPGFQIFDQGILLAGFIDSLKSQPPDRAIALVLNGDVVDFLAEEPASYLDANHAVDKLIRILTRDPAFCPVTAALGAFIGEANRTLVIVLGNHDVELALPPAAEWLANHLSGGDATRRGRIRFALDGAGFACRVGGKRVLCVHGNEVDTWNVVDHRQLLEVARALNRGTPPPAWTPNAGTKMVIDVMNGIKSRMPFVDLLKPEVEAVPAVLLALDPSQVRRIGALLLVVGRLARDAARISTGFLSAEDAPPPMAGDTADTALDAYMREHFVGQRSATVEIDALLDRAESAVGQPAAGLSRSAATETLGIGGLIFDSVLRRPPEQNLRETLAKWLAGDETWNPLFEDTPFRQLDAAVAPEVDVLVSGHTHLHRALRRTRGRGAYFNSGSWIRLIALGADVLSDATRFAPVYAALKGTMSDIDGAGIVKRIPTVVRIVSGPGGVTGGLTLAVDKGGGIVALDPVPGTELVI